MIFQYSVLSGDFESIAAGSVVTTTSISSTTTTTTATTTTEEVDPGRVKRSGLGIVSFMFLAAPQLKT